MKIVIGSTREWMGRLAADDAAKKIAAAIAANGVARVVFASAASQFEFLKALVAHKEIDWTKVCGFHLDELFDRTAAGGSDQRFRHGRADQHRRQQRPRAPVGHGQLTQQSGRGRRTGSPPAGAFLIFNRQESKKK